MNRSELVQMEDGSSSDVGSRAGERGSVGWLWGGGKDER